MCLLRCIFLHILTRDSVNPNTKSPTQTGLMVGVTPSPASSFTREPLLDLGSPYSPVRRIIAQFRSHPEFVPQRLQAPMATPWVPGQSSLHSLAPAPPVLSPRLLMLVYRLLAGTCCSFSMALRHLIQHGCASVETPLSWVTGQHSPASTLLAYKRAFYLQFIFYYSDGQKSDGHRYQNQSCTFV